MATTAKHVETLAARDGGSATRRCSTRATTASSRRRCRGSATRSPAQEPIARRRQRREDRAPARGAGRRRRGRDLRRHGRRRRQPRAHHPRVARVRRRPRRRGAAGCGASASRSGPTQPRRARRVPAPRGAAQPRLRGAEDFWLLCPYDVDALDARRHRRRPHHSHPAVVADGAPARERHLRGPRARSPAPFAEPLPEPPADADELAFAAGTLAARAPARRAARASDAGLPGSATGDLVLAVNEVATNSIRHGGGGGVLRVWQADATRWSARSPTRGAHRRSARRARAPGQRPVGRSRACGCATRSATSSSCAPSPRGSVVRLHTRRGA